MAKREIPEINAGSMADIAFLLLIFFLVTTTMDRDKAWIRNIPKKIEVPIPPEPIEERNIMAIKANDANQLMVRGELMENPDNISEKILEFYRMNEQLSQAETESAAANPSHPGYNYPFYTRIDLNYIKAKKKEAEAAVDEADMNPNVDAEFVRFLQSIVDGWDDKKEALQFYGKPILPEISTQAHVRIEVKQKTNYGLFAKIHSEIEEAIFELRDATAKDLWGVSYKTISARVDTDDREKYATEFNQFDLLELLYPRRIIEVTPK